MSIFLILALIIGSPFGIIAIAFLLALIPTETDVDISDPDFDNFNEMGDDDDQS